MWVDEKRACSGGMGERGDIREQDGVRRMTKKYEGEGGGKRLQTEGITMLEDER